MADDLPPEFYDLVDRFIGLADEPARDHNTSRVGAVIMFAAARYNAHCMLALDPNAPENREAAVAYFGEQYRRMLEDNIDRLMRLQGRAQGAERSDPADPPSSGR